MKDFETKTGPSLQLFTLIRVNTPTSSALSAALSGILVDADTAEQAQEIAEEIDMDQWTDGGDYEFVVDHVAPWNEK